MPSTSPADFLLAFHLAKAEMFFSVPVFFTEADVLQSTSVDICSPSCFSARLLRSYLTTPTPTYNYCTNLFILMCAHTPNKLLVPENSCGCILLWSHGVFPVLCPNCHPHSFWCPNTFVPTLEKMLRTLWKIGTALEKEGRETLHPDVTPLSVWFLPCSSTNTSSKVDSCVRFWLPSSERMVMPKLIHCLPGKCVLFWSQKLFYQTVFVFNRCI